MNPENTADSVPNQAHRPSVGERILLKANSGLKKQHRFVSGADALFKDYISFTPFEYKLMWTFKTLVQLMVGKQQKIWPYVTVSTSAAAEPEEINTAPQVITEDANSKLAVRMRIPAHAIGEIVWSWSLHVEHGVDDLGSRVAVDEMQWPMYRDGPAHRMTHHRIDMENRNEVRAWICEAQRAYRHWYSLGGRLENEDAKELLNVSQDWL